MSFAGVTSGIMGEFTDTCIPRAHPNVSDSSQKLTTRNALHRLQAAQQVGYLFFLYAHTHLAVC